MKYSKKETAQLILDHGKYLERRTCRDLESYTKWVSLCVIGEIYLFNRKVYLVTYRKKITQSQPYNDVTITPISAEEIELSWYERMEHIKFKTNLICFVLFYIIKTFLIFWKEIYT